MRKNKNRRPKPIPVGMLTYINGRHEQIQFTHVCCVCKQIILGWPIKIPRPDQWEWTEDGSVKFENDLCCIKQECIQTSVAKFRKAIEQGIEIKGNPPKNLAESFSRREERKEKEN